MSPDAPTRATVGAMNERVNLREKLSLFVSHWDPKIVGELNGQHVKLVKFQGEFVWHHHEHEDELFLVVSGRFTMQFRDRNIPLEQGELTATLVSIATALGAASVSSVGRIAPSSSGLAGRSGTAGLAAISLTWRAPAR